MKKIKQILIKAIAIASVLMFVSTASAITIELVGQYATADLAFDVAVAGNYAYIADRSDGYFCPFIIINDNVNSRFIFFFSCFYFWQRHSWKTFQIKRKRNYNLYPFRADHLSYSGCIACHIF